MAYHLAMNTPILTFVLRHLRSREVPWTVVARESGVPYQTLKKIGAGATANPGVLHVQSLFDYFSGREQIDAAKQPEVV